MTITLNPRALFGLAVGLAIAAIALFAFQSMTADAVDEGESTFVGVTPCRLFDTRPGGVGLRSTPLGADETHDFQVTGTNGDCTIPADATGISINLTGVGPTANTNLRVFPAGAAVPNAAAVNMQAGQGPTPNKLDVKLSSDGKVAVFNRFGSIDVIGDVMGYYRSDGLTDLETRLAALEAAATGQDAKIAALEADVVALETKLASVTIETVDGQPTVRFTGVNIQIVDGSGDTAGAVNGMGNLIVGYNENVGDVRTGSHNIVVGERQSYSSYGGLAAGYDNSVSGPNSVVAGGGNTASGIHSSVTGGSGNTASGQDSAVSGGSANSASALNASVTGGRGNTASAQDSAVSGGINNVASFFWSSVSGGSQNTANGNASSVTGGFLNIASGTRSSITGGQSNLATGETSAVSGGNTNTASGTNSSVSGGTVNVASGFNSSVTGGGTNTASGSESSVNGGSTNEADLGASTVSGGSTRVVSGLGGDGFDWVGGGLFQSF